MKVIVATRYDNSGASSRLRFFDLEEAFGRSANVEFDCLFDGRYVSRIGSRSRIAISFLAVSALFRRAFRLAKGRREPDRNSLSEVLVIEKELFPGIPAWAERLFIAFLRPRTIVYDIDDGLHLQHEGRGVIKMLRGGKYERLWRSGDAVVVGSPQLEADLESMVGEEVDLVLIPTTVNIARYTPKRTYELSSPIRIGWIGSPTTAFHLECLGSTLRNLSRDYLIELIVVGAEPPSEVQEFARFVEWTLEGEAELCRSFDVGIMPLADGEFARRKCGYKLIQYMASGVPVVGSDVGVNRLIVEGNGQSAGIIVDRWEDWEAAIRTLLSDGDLRSKMGVAGPKIVESCYSTDVAIGMWEALLRRVAQETTGK